jgi:Tol biopolymer transport system component
MASIQGIYIALFGRPADPEGLAYWNGVTNNGADLSGLIGVLTHTPEYLARFETMTPAETISALYLALFNRAPDQQGLDYFLKALESGAQTMETIAINIFDGAQNGDLETLSAKVEAADAFTTSLDTPEELAAYVGTDAAELGRQFLSNVDQSNPSTTLDLNKWVAKLLPPSDTGGGGDTPPSPAYAISVSNASVVEGSGNTISFTVTRVGATDAATISVVLTGGATVGTDYTTTLVNGQLSFAQGATTASFSVTPINDVRAEGNETVVATISDPSDGVTITTASVTATIVDDERLTLLTPNASMPSNPAQMSGDGSVIAFSSLATNLDPNITDTNDKMDVLVYRDGAYTNITAHGSGDSFHPEVSRDGSTIVFFSKAQDLIEGVSETNGFENIFVYRDGTLINLTAHADTGSFTPSVSADGSAIVFTSAASNLDPDVVDHNQQNNVFLYRGGKITNITANANDYSGMAAISADGSTVVFISDATNLIEGYDDTNGMGDIFVYRDGTLTNITAGSNSGADPYYGFDPRISADGSTIVFTSEATNLIDGQVDENGVADIFIYRDGVITNITLNGDAESSNPVISADGSTIAFTSKASNLVDGVTDSNGTYDVFVYRNGVLSAITSHGNGSSMSPWLSADGSKLAFVSHATNLIDGVTPIPVGNVYLYELI